MRAVMSTYTAEGWTDREIDVDGRAAEQLATRAGLPLRTEDDAVRAVNALLDLGRSVGPWIGQRLVTAVPDWRGICVPDHLRVG